MCDVIALTVRDRLKGGETSKGRERKGEREEKFLPGALKFLSCACPDLRGSGCSVCMLNKSCKDFHFARGANEETETGNLFNSTSSCPILCRA